MEAPPDLVRASREDLIVIIVQQREEIAALRREHARQAAELATVQGLVTRLTTRLGEALAALGLPDGDDPAPRPPAMPGLKPAPGQTPAARPRPPRKRRGHGYGRKRMTPTARQVHADGRCPACQSPLRGGTRKRRRAVITLIPARVEVTEHVYVERRCPRCHGRWQPGPELDGLVVGQRRFGHELLSLIAFLREELRLPIRAIQGYLATVAGLSLSVGSIVDALHLLAERADEVIAGLREQMRAGPVLHVDETGWRDDGRNGYAWTFSTATERVFVHGGRDRGVLTAMGGDEYPGVLVSDFYAVYTGYAGRHQYGWAHLLRDVDALVSQHPADAGVRGWADAIHALYQRAAAAAADSAPVARRAARQACEARYRALVAAADDVIYTMDLTGVLLSINPAVEQVTGYRPDELIGRSIAILVAPDDFVSSRVMLERPFAAPAEPVRYRRTRMVLRTLAIVLLVAGVVEEAELDARRDLRKEHEVRARPVPGGAEREWPALGDPGAAQPRGGPGEGVVRM